MKIVIAGGGRVGGVLASRLIAERHQVTVIERDKATCERLFEELGVVTVRGEAMDPRVLESAGLVAADVACAVLPRDADNLAFAMLVRSLGSARVMVRMLDDAYRPAYLLAGVRDLIAEAEVVVTKMVTAIDFPQLSASLPLAGGAAILFQVVIKPRATVAGKTITEVRAVERFPKECVFIGFIDADGKITLPDGNTVLQPGHTALLVTRREALAQAVESLTSEPPLHDPVGHLLPALRRVDFLAPLNDAEVERVARSMAVTRRKAGEVLFRKGDEGETFYILLGGEVALSSEGDQVVERVQAGGFFGELSLLTGQPRSATATVQGGAELAEVGRDDFQGIVMANPTIAVAMSRILGQRLANTAKRAPPARRSFFGR